MAPQDLYVPLFGSMRPSTFEELCEGHPNGAAFRRVVERARSEDGCSAGE